MIQSEIQEFIDNHNKQYINYCEAIIHSNGDIEYAIPSHQIKLKEIWGVKYNPYSDTPSKAEQLLWKTIPMEADVCEWLCEDLQCISVWYRCAIIPINYTEQSLTTYIELMKHGCIDKDSIIKVSIEKSLIQLRQEEKFDELNKLFEERNKKQQYINKLVSSIK